MKTIRMNLDEIGGEELTQKDKALFKGGDEVQPHCNFHCVLHDQYHGKIMDGGACGRSVLEVEYNCNMEYMYEGWHCHCWEVYEQ